MPRRTFALGLILILSAHADAQQIDRKKVRELIYLPTISIGCGAAVTADGDLILAGEQKSGREKIAALEKALCGDAGDAERYRRLSWLYLDDAKAKQAADKAVDLARGQLTKEPTNGRLAMQLGRALWAGEQFDESEKLSRQAVALAPKDTDCWRTLGGQLLRRSYQMLVGTSVKRMDVVDALKLPATRFPPEAIAKSRKYMKEAGQCYDRAVTLAPRQARPYLARAGFRAQGSIVLALQQGLFEERLEPAMMRGMYVSENVSDMHKAADVTPNEPRVQIAAAFWELMNGMQPEAEGDAPPRTRLPAESKRKMAQLTKRLTQLEKSDDNTIAAQACYGRALITMVSANPRRERDADRLLLEMKKWLQRAVSLQPRFEPSWDLLIRVLAEPEFSNELVSACEEHLRSADTPRNRFMAAKAHMDLDHFAQAEQHLRAALRSDPKDARSQLALSAVLLKRGDDAGIQEADRLLRQAEALLRGKKQSSLKTDAAVLRAFQTALAGDSAAARRSLRNVEIDDENRNDRVARLRELLGD